MNNDARHLSSSNDVIILVRTPAQGGFDLHLVGTLISFERYCYLMKDSQNAREPYTLNFSLRHNVLGTPNLSNGYKCVMKLTTGDKCRLVCLWV